MRRKTESTKDNTKEKAVITVLSPSTRRASAAVEEENMDVSEIEVCCGNRPGIIFAFAGRKLQANLNY